MSEIYIVNIINVCQVRWIVIVFRINYVHSPDGNRGSVREQLKRCTQGLARTRIVLCRRPGADTEETGRYDFSVERFGVVFWMLSK